nr:DUF3596 domain-containing protein [Citrobacter portucalensis]
MSGYPTGVENHGGTLRIWFIYNGKRVRESLGVVDTAKKQAHCWGASRLCLFRYKNWCIRLRQIVSTVTQPEEIQYRAAGDNCC